MNIVDLLGILPYFASLILSLVMTATARGRETANYQASYRDIQHTTQLYVVCIYIVWLF